MTHIYGAVVDNADGEDNEGNDDNDGNGDDDNDNDDVEEECCSAAKLLLVV